MSNFLRVSFLSIDIKLSVLKKFFKERNIVQFLPLTVPLSVLKTLPNENL